MVAKRQAALVRFGSVIVITGSGHAAATKRVYRKVFEDWRTLQDGGLGRGGRDLALDVRIQAIATEKQRKLEQEKARLEKEERDRKNFAKLAAMREEIGSIYEVTMPAIRAIASGDGEVELSEQRRLQRKQELQLLLKTTPELKQLSNYQ